MRLWAHIRLQKPDLGGRSVTRASKDNRNGHAKNFQVQQYVPVFNVLQIKHDVLFERRIMAGGHLPKTGEARCDVEPPKMLKIIALEIIFRMRARTHYAHIALEDVKQLWEFVNAVFAKETAEAGNTRIVNNLERGAVALIHVHQAVLAGVSVRTHGTELIAAEFTSLASHTPSFIENWPRGVDLDGYGR